MDKYDAYRIGRLSIKYPAFSRETCSPMGNAVFNTYYHKGRRDEQHMRDTSYLYYRAFNATPEQLAAAANRARELHMSQGEKYPLEDVEETGYDSIPPFSGWNC